MDPGSNTLHDKRGNSEINGPLTEGDVASVVKAALRPTDVEPPAVAVWGAPVVRGSPKTSPCADPPVACAVRNSDSPHGPEDAVEAAVWVGPGTTSPLGPKSRILDATVGGDAGAVPPPGTVQRLLGKRRPRHQAGR